MPQNQPPGDADALRYLRNRLDKLEQEVRWLKSSAGKAYLDRGDYEAIPNPSEGQTMVHFETDEPWYYSRGEWRPFGGGIMPWMKVKQVELGQTFDPNDARTLIYDDIINPYPDVFEPYMEDTECWGIKALTPGIYQATCRIEPFTPRPDIGFELLFYGVDRAFWGPYSNTITGDVAPSGLTRNTSQMAYAEITWRGYDHVAGPANEGISVHIITGAEGFDLYDQGGTYLEVRRLSKDPFHPLGLDDGTKEGVPP